MERQITDRKGGGGGEAYLKLDPLPPQTRHWHWATPGLVEPQAWSGLDQRRRHYGRLRPAPVRDAARRHHTHQAPQQYSAVGSDRGPDATLRPHEHGIPTRLAACLAGSSREAVQAAGRGGTGEVPPCTPVMTYGP